MKLEDIATNECDCAFCVSACHSRVGWPLPSEAARLMDDPDVGAKKLMLDWWSGSPDILVVAPALTGFEADIAPRDPRGRCTFLTNDDRCSIHTSGAKPVECRRNQHAGGEQSIHAAVADAWDSDEGRAVVDRWRKETGCDDEVEGEYRFFGW